MSSHKIKIILGLESLFAALPHKETVANRPVPKVIPRYFILNMFLINSNFAYNSSLTLLSEILLLLLDFFQLLRIPLFLQPFLLQLSGRFCNCSSQSGNRKL
jgi:hypothetical protein